MTAATRAAAAQHGAGIAWIVLSVACFGALDTTSKLVTGSVPVVMALWVRYVVQTLATGALLLPRHGRRLLHTRQPGRQALRAALLVACNGLAYLSLGVLQVGEFTAVTMLLPLLLTVVAAVALHEHVPASRWACLLGAFAGVLLVIRPGPALLQQPATLLPLLLVAGNAAFQLLTRAMTRDDAPGTIHLYSGLGGLALTSAALPLAWLPLDARQWLLLGLMGLFGAAGHFLLIVAYAKAPVAVLTPYLYLQILFATLGGWLVFSHLPDHWALAGMALVAVCGVVGTWLARREALAAALAA